MIDKKPPAVWEPPSAEVKTGKIEDIRKRAAKLREEYWSTFITRGAQGAGAALTYLKSLDARRTDAIKQMNDLHREAMQINRGIENEISRGLKFVAGTKFVADVGVTLAGFTPGGLLVKTGVQVIYGGANYVVQTQVAETETQAAASKQLVVGLTQNGADVASDGAREIAKRFAAASGDYSADAAAIAARLKEANHTASSRLTYTLMEQRKIGLASETIYKANNWKFAGVVLKGASIALAGYSIYLSYEDFKSATK